MSGGVLFVETRPNSPEELETYHKWYDEVHVPEILSVEGFVAARRFRTDGESFIAIYDIEGDVSVAQTRLREAFASGRMSTPQGVQMNPPATQRYFQLIGDFRA